MIFPGDKITTMLSSSSAICYYILFSRVVGDERKIGNNAAIRIVKWILDKVVLIERFKVVGLV
jgi:hypothetical protein